MNQHQYIFLCLLSLFCSCSTCQLKNQKVLATWGNGQIKTIRYFEGHLEFEENYHSTGQLASKGLLVNEEKQKEWTYYYPNGKIKKKAYYRENIPFGKVQTFYDNGQIKTEEEIDETGQPIGEWKLYNHDGILSKAEIFGFDVQTEEKSSYYSHTDEWSEPEGIGKPERLNVDKLGNTKGSSFKEEKGRVATFDHFVSEKGQIIDQGKQYKDHSIYHWIFWYDNGQKRAEGNYLFADEGATETISIGYSKRKELLDTYYEVKIGKWTYWNTSGKKIATVDYQLHGKLVKEKIVFWKGRKR